MPYTYDISEYIIENKTTEVPLEKVHFRLLKISGDIEDGENNCIQHSYSIERTIIPGIFIPGFLCKPIQRKLFTKYFISKDGTVIVYTYYFPNTEKPIFVTMTERPVLGLKKIPSLEFFKHDDYTEAEFLSILKKYGKNEL